MLLKMDYNNIICLLNVIYFGIGIIFFFFDKFSWFFVVFMIIIIIIGSVCGNLFVCLVIGFNKCFWKIINYFIFFLVIFDFLIVLFFMFFDVEGDFM